MLDCHLGGKNASNEVTLLHAVQWVTKASRMVKTETISNCFRKATVFGAIYGPERKPKEWDEDLYQRTQMQQVINDLAQAGAIRNAMDITNFVLPTGERLESNYVSSWAPGSFAAEDEFLSTTLDEFVQAYTTQDEDEDEDEVATGAPPEMTLAEAVEHISKSIIWLQREMPCDLDLLAIWRRKLRSLLMQQKREITEGKKQTTMDMYFSRAN